MAGTGPQRTWLGRVAAIVHSGAMGSTGVRLASMFAGLFVIHGAQLTYLPVWLDARGLTAAQIAFTTSAPTLLRLLVTPAIAIAADRSQAHRRTVQALCWSALALLLALSQLDQAPVIIAVVIVMLVVVQSIMPLVDTLTMRAVREQGLDYGRIRLWGSATFILSSYAAGFSVAAGGAASIVWLLLAGAALTAAAAHRLPTRAESGPAASQHVRLTPADGLALAAEPRFVLFALAASAIQASHALFYVFGVLHWRAQGLSAGVIGTLWAVSVVAEIGLFWASRRVAMVGPSELIAIGAAAGLVRWTAMAFDPPVALLVPLQILHAGSFAATHLGAMHWIARSVPDHQAGTAQALFSTASAGIGMGGAMLLSGWLYTTFAGGAYLGMAALCAAGGAAALVLRTMSRFDAS